MARKPGPPSKDLVDKVWQKGKPIPGKNPDVHRKDAYGNPIYKPSFGKEGEKSWEIDHKKPIAKGGTDTAKAKGSPSPYDTSTLKQILIIGLLLLFLTSGNIHRIDLPSQLVTHDS